MIVRDKNIFLILAIAFFSLLHFAQAENEIDIYNEEFYFPNMNLPAPDTNFIDMGMCSRGDSLVTTFILNNNSANTIYVRNVDPSFILSKVDGKADDHEKLDYTEIGFQVDEHKEVLPGETEKIRIRYYPDENSAPGKEYYAFVGIGFINSTAISNITYEDLLLRKNYILKYRLTENPIDGYEDFFRMDSVYLNPDNEPASWDWRVQNSSNDSYIITDFKSKMLTPYDEDKPEFIVDFSDQMNYTFPAGSKNYMSKWNIRYKPFDLEYDKIEVSLGYKKDINDSETKYTSVEVEAVGVTQRLDARSSVPDADIYRGTLPDGDSVTVIDFGDFVPVGAFQRFRVIFTNTGNMPIGAIQPKLSDEYFQPLGNDVYVLAEAEQIEDGDYIFPGATKIVTFDVKISDVGKFEALYSFKSDIADRNITGYSQKDTAIVFKLVAEGILPDIDLNTDPKNFHVVVTDFCIEPKRDSVKIFNYGKAELRISSLRINRDKRYANVPFEVSPKEELIVPPQSESWIKITCKRDDGWGSSLPEVRTDTLYFETIIDDSLHKFNILLNAEGVGPSSSVVNIGDFRARPGRIVSVPIIVSGSEVNRAGEFTGILEYDNSLLHFLDYELAGTACEGAIDSEIEISESTTGELNRLTLDLKMPEQEQSRFISSDTLILLKFNSYLGNKVQTNIDIIDPVFGDGSCYNILDLDVKQGSFRLDSLCGLDWKTSIYDEYFAAIEKIFPNPASESYTIEYFVFQETDIEIAMYNSYGVLIFAEKYGKKEMGTHSIKIISEGIMPGIYHLVLNAGNERTAGKIIISR